MKSFANRTVLAAALVAVSAAAAGADSMMREEDGELYVDQTRVVEEKNTFGYGMREAPEGMYYAIIDGDLVTVERETGKVMHVLPISASLMK